MAPARTEIRAGAGYGFRAPRFGAVSIPVQRLWNDMRGVTRRWPDEAPS